MRGTNRYNPDDKDPGESSGVRDGRSVVSSRRGTGTRHSGTGKDTDCRSWCVSSFVVDQRTELTLGHELVGLCLRLAVTNVLLEGFEPAA